MKVDTSDILNHLFNAAKTEPEGVNRKKFRAKHHKDKEHIDFLESKQIIRRENDVYHISLIALHDIREVNKDAGHILYLCELLFSVLRSFYKENAGDPISLNEIAKRADIPRSDVNKCIPYFMESLLHEGYTTNPKDEDSATINPAEKILDYESFDESIKAFKGMRESSNEWGSFSLDTIITEEYFQGHDYIHQERISKLRILNSGDFDLSRLVQICNEINSSARNNNHLSLIALLRILLDHVPPIFGMKSFKEVAANYKSGRSLKKTLEHLENSSRNIADGNIHQPIRKMETLPTFNQVNFSQDVDRLLEEIIRITEEIPKD